MFLLWLFFFFLVLDIGVFSLCYWTSRFYFHYLSGFFFFRLFVVWVCDVYSHGYALINVDEINCTSVLCCAYETKPYHLTLNLHIISLNKLRERKRKRQYYRERKRAAFPIQKQLYENGIENENTWEMWRNVNGKGDENGILHKHIVCVFVCMCICSVANPITVFTRIINKIFAHRYHFHRLKHHFKNRLKSLYARSHTQTHTYQGGFRGERCLFILCVCCFCLHELRQKKISSRVTLMRSTVLNRILCSWHLTQKSTLIH